MPKYIEYVSLPPSNINPNDPPGQRKCKTCGETKPIDNFTYHTRLTRNGVKKYLRTSCKPCTNAYQRELCHESKLNHWRRNKRRYKENLDRWRANNPDKLLAQTLRRLYGITLEDYYGMLAQQGGVCAICRNPPSDKRCRYGRLAVDHCHDTGKVRGLLCDHCNHMLGSAFDLVDTLRAGIDYLTRFRNGEA